jgi:hypothetical protein
LKNYKFSAHILVNLSPHYVTNYYQGKVQLPF